MGYKGAGFALETRCSRLFNFQSLFYKNKNSLRAELIHYSEFSLRLPSVSLDATLIELHKLFLHKKNNLKLDLQM